ncbi:MAG: zinc ribbon domain-containing protein [Azoarcus sp.]|nr:zinc ribbon domain-containing protein [Azoarcus sp.]
MPIYEYRCASCGFQKEHLQKMSDPVLTVCPSCGAERYLKQISVAGFQLKGSGWYATDFKCGGGAKGDNTPASDTPPCASGCACHAS